MLFCLVDSKEEIIIFSMIYHTFCQDKLKSFPRCILNNNYLINFINNIIELVLFDYNNNNKCL